MLASTSRTRTGRGWRSICHRLQWPRIGLFHRKEDTAARLHRHWQTSVLRIRIGFRLRWCILPDWTGRIRRRGGCLVLRLPRSLMMPRCMRAVMRQWFFYSLLKVVCLRKTEAIGLSLLVPICVYFTNLMLLLPLTATYKPFCRCATDTWLSSDASISCPQESKTFTGPDADTVIVDAS